MTPNEHGEAAEPKEATKATEAEQASEARWVTRAKGTLPRFLAMRFLVPLHNPSGLIKLRLFREKFSAADEV